MTSGEEPGHRAPEEQPPPTLRPPDATVSRAERRRARAAAERSRLRTVLLAVLGGLVVAAGLVVGLGTLAVQDVANDVSRVEEVFPVEGRRPEASAADALTFLVVGVDPSDQATGSTRAEAALLVRLTGDRQDLQAVTLPLETPVPGSSGTLEEAYRGSGPSSAVEAVETLTDVRIDHYAELDHGGLALLVDALGGVTVDVPEPYGNRGCDFAPGRQRMDGAETVAYLRDADARVGAAARQQRVVQALVDRVRERGAFGDRADLEELVGSVTNSAAWSGRRPPPPPPPCRCAARARRGPRWCSTSTRRGRRTCGRTCGRTTWPRTSTSSA
ncbi:LCP family protein [Geodermatophilus sp. SYSU D00758]